jgi:DNA-binding CsgD family transcriptional regulator
MGHLDLSTSIKPAAINAANYARNTALIDNESQPARPHAGHFRRLLDGVPIPAIVLDADRSIVLRNAAARDAPKNLACLSLSYGHVHRFSGTATEPFERVFCGALNGTATSAVITLRASDRSTFWRVSLARVSDEGTSAPADVLMLIYPPASIGGTSIALQRLFDLTAAEACVLALLLDHFRPREIAEELGISITTVRSHLQALFAKTGTRRQSELVALAWSAA